MDLFDLEKEELTNLKLRKITIQNYRNIAYKEIEVGENGIVLSGENGIGKTNVIEAVYWLLSGKLFNGVSKSYSQGITPVDAEKGVKTSVKVEFDYQNYTFEKITYENWGKNGDNYQGTETAYYVNGALVKKNKQAVELLEEYLGVSTLREKMKATKLRDLDMFALIFNINYIEQIDYQSLRELIVDIIGEVNYLEIINENPEKYGALVEPLKLHNRELETVKQAYRTEKFGNKHKKGVESQIEITKSTIEELETLASKAVDEEEIRLSKEKVKELDNEIYDLEVNLKQDDKSALGDYDLKIAQKENEISKAEKVIRDEYELQLKNYSDDDLKKTVDTKKESIQSMRETRSDLTEKIDELTSDRNKLATRLDNKKHEIERLQERRQELITKWQSINNDTNSETVTCPICEKPFQLHETKEHQEIKDKKLNEINQEGQDIKTRIEELTEGIETTEDELEEKNNEIIELQKEREQLDKNGKALKAELEELQKELDETVSSKPELDFSVEPILTLRKELNRLRNAKSETVVERSVSKQKALTKLDNMKREREELSEQLNAESIQKSYQKNAKEKRKELTALQKRLTEIEEVLLLIKELEREMFTQLDKKVADKFGSNIKFQLFKENIDGTVDSRMCEMLVKDRWGNFVNIKTINTGIKPIRATEFIQRVKDHYGILKSFVFIDELGALDNNSRKELVALGEQIIATDVSEDKKMSVKSIEV
jgi:chromosome segregation ATPase